MLICDVAWSLNYGARISAGSYGCSIMICLTPIVRVCQAKTKNLGPACYSGQSAFVENTADKLMPDRYKTIRCCSSVVEHVLGKDGVKGSSPFSS